MKLEEADRLAQGFIEKIGKEIVLEEKLMRKKNKCLEVLDA